MCDTNGEFWYQLGMHYYILKNKQHGSKSTIAYIKINMVCSSWIATLAEKWPHGMPTRILYWHYCKSSHSKPHSTEILETMTAPSIYLRPSV